MVRVLVIPADEYLPCAVADVDLSDEAVRKRLGGTTEPCRLDLIDAKMLARDLDEEPLPFNPRATALLAFHQIPFPTGYPVEGDAMVFDNSDDPDRTDTGGVTHLLTLLQAPALRIWTRQGPDEAWKGLPGQYASLDGAFTVADAGMRIAHRVAPGSTAALAITVRSADTSSALEHTPHPHG